VTIQECTQCSLPVPLIARPDLDAQNWLLKPASEGNLVSRGSPARDDIILPGSFFHPDELAACTRSLLLTLHFCALCCVSFSRVLQHRRLCRQVFSRNCRKACITSPCVAQQLHVLDKAACLVSLMVRSTLRLGQKLRGAELSLVRGPPKWL